MRDFLSFSLSLSLSTGKREREIHTTVVPRRTFFDIYIEYNFYHGSIGLGEPSISSVANTLRTYHFAPDAHSVSILTVITHQGGKELPKLRCNRLHNNLRDLYSYTCTIDIGIRF